MLYSYKIGRTPTDHRGENKWEDPLIKDFWSRRHRSYRPRETNQVNFPATVPQLKKVISAKQLGSKKIPELKKLVQAEHSIVH